MELDRPGPSAWVRLPLGFAAAVAMAWGAALAWELPGGGDDGATIGCIAGTVASAVALRARTGRWRARAIVMLAACAGATLAALEGGEGAERPWAPREPGPVELHGTIDTEPRIVDSGGDVLASFVRREASQSFLLAVAGCTDAAAIRPATGRATVRVAGTAPLPGRGSRVTVRGWVTPREPTPAIEVPSATLVLRHVRDPVTDALCDIRRAAHRSLARSMPEWADDGRRALVAAMTVGTRLPGLAGHAAEFRDAGMSHVLAISGFNVAVLVAAAAAVARIAGVRPVGRSAVAVAVAVAFLAITEPETSVLRAGVGAAIGAAAGLRGGRARGLGTLGATAILAMACDVGCIRGAGFQLSYGVVAALLLVAPAPARRWDGRARAWIGSLLRPMTAPHEAAVIVAGWLVAATVASLVAWTVSTPIAMAHGGSLSMLAAPLSVATMPVAAITTVAGVAAMSTAEAWPAAGGLMGGVAAASAGMLAATAASASRAMPSVMPVSETGAAAVAATILLACAAWCGPSAIARRACAAAAVALVGLLVAGIGRDAVAERDVVRCTSLSTGSGHCTLLRCGGTAVLVDAGGEGTDVGSRTLVPALRSLGVTALDAVVVTGGSMSSVAGVPEVARALAVGRAVFWRESLERLGSGGDGLGRTLLRDLRDRAIVPSAVDGGVVHRLGEIEMRLVEGSTRSGRPRIDAVEVRAAAGGDPHGWITLRRSPETAAPARGTRSSPRSSRPAS